MVLFKKKCCFPNVLPHTKTMRFSRCLDLYLVPRALKQRMNVDPEPWHAFGTRVSLWSQKSEDWMV